MKKKTLYAVLIILLASASFFRFSRPEEVVVLEKQSPSRGEVRKVVNVDAKVKAERYADIAADSPTLIESFSVDENETVSEGQELLRLDMKSLEAQAQEALAALRRAEAAERHARRKWDLLKPEQKEEIKQATEQARAAYRKAAALTEKAIIRSPLDGVVVRKNARAGEVASGILLRIIDPKSLYLEALIPESDIGKVSVGDETTVVFDAYPDKKLGGRLASLGISGVLRQGNTYFKARVELEDKEEILFLEGLNAEVDIQIDSRENVLRIPRRFVKKDEEGYFVYVAGKEEGKPFQKRRFQSGLIGEDYVEILSGLEEKDVVLSIQSN